MTFNGVARLFFTSEIDEGYIMKTSLILAALTLSATAFAQEAAQEPARQPATTPGASAQWPAFESLDTNADGRLSSSEAQVAPTVAAKFSTLDKQGKGYVTKEEYQAQAKGDKK